MRGVTLRHRIDGGLIVFQPALPMRGVTSAEVEANNGQIISTRTPHAGSDKSVVPSRYACVNFNPHSPCGE